MDTTRNILLLAIVIQLIGLNCGASALSDRLREINRTCAVSR